MPGSRKFGQRGSNFDNVLFFLVDERKEDPNTTKSGPSSLKWCFADGPMMGQH